MLLAKGTHSQYLSVAILLAKGTLSQYLSAAIHLAKGTSNGNASETKANESFDNSVFFDIEAKQTPSLESKLFSKGSEHIR